VEDEVIVAEGLQRALEASGYAVVGHAMQANEAVRLVERWHPDVVLMDVNLDGASEGIDAARTIQRVSDAAVVFVSAYTDEAVLSDAVGAGALGFVVKPFQPRQITSAIAVALHRRRELARALAPRPSGDAMAATPASDEYSAMLSRLETILYDDKAWATDTTDSIPARFHITPREWDIVRGLVCYRRLPQVAEALGISACTARNHLKSVFRKLNLHSQDELFRFLLGR
jgi:DNA-binding NarL/FixJ family response regulator